MTAGGADKCTRCGTRSLLVERERQSRACGICLCGDLTDAERRARRGPRRRRMLGRARLHGAPRRSPSEVWAPP